MKPDSQTPSPSPDQDPEPSPQERTNRPVFGIVVGTILVALCCVCSVGIVSNAFKSDTTGKQKAASSMAVSAVATSTPTRSAATPTNSSVQSASESASPMPTSVKLPNLVGKNAAIAQDELKRLGLKNIQFGSADSRYSMVILPQNWTVVRQAPSAGTPMTPDQLVILSCKKL
jgi:hypothetical protein